MTNAHIKYIIFALIYVAMVTTFLPQIPSARAQNPQIDLIGQQTIWQPYAAAIVTQNDTSLDIIVSTNFTGELWNRAYLPITVNSADNKPTLFNLVYASDSNVGNATFTAEIRDNKTSKVLWNDSLNNTRGQFRDQFFVLPDSVLNSQVEFRLYVITDGPGEHAMTIKKATISFSNVTKPVGIETP